MPAQAHLISPKPVYLDDVPIGSAATWFEVAEIISKRVGTTFTGKHIQRHASEGPHGFYVKLRLHPDTSE